MRDRELREIQSRLGRIMPDVNAKTIQLEDSLRVLSERIIELEREIESHIGAARTLAQILLRVATRHGDPILLGPNVSTLVGNYLPRDPAPPVHDRQRLWP
jgi:hypothetical protein